MQQVDGDKCCKWFATRWVGVEIQDGNLLMFFSRSWLKAGLGCAWSFGMVVVRKSNGGRRAKISIKAAEGRHRPLLGIPMLTFQLL